VKEEACQENITQTLPNIQIFFPMQIVSHSHDTTTSAAPRLRNKFLTVLLVPLILAIGGRLVVAAEKSIESELEPEPAGIVYLPEDTFAKGIDFAKSVPRDYRDAIEWHAKVYQRTLEQSGKAWSVIENYKSAKDTADYAQHVAKYMAAEKDLGFYAIAETQAQEMIEKKYGKMKFVKNNGQLQIADFDGKAVGQYSGAVVAEVCGPEGCAPVDPVVALFAILAGWFENAANDDRFPSASKALAYRAKYPLGGPNSELGKFRRKYFSGRDVFSKQARNPFKSTVEIHSQMIKGLKKTIPKINNKDIKIHKDDIKIHKDDIKKLFKW
jgi:hypothetical protein